LEELRETLGDEGEDASTPLSQLLTALRLGRSPLASLLDQPDTAALLDVVHKAIRNAGDLQGVLGPAVRQGMDAAGVESLEIVYRCPLHYCVGRTSADVTEFPPHCKISGKELIRERLP